ncbi:acyltransferase family protein [Frederiksenia canicola]|uniref:Acyltransferase n=1 Tax=Frederiksenia canicola TaxID=123824 RepID=A0AAE6X3U8_9PAST|nr:acyltransferase [Frederiksenia canicola]QIM64073.1 acyltransferase [Frederiksenia canicola]RPE93603.1 peptidoglycan/LPS O-acetylase OafA/YrhL [Frederiksenia canicola]
MKSLNTSYFSRLDHLRFFAAALVLLHHFRGKISLSAITEVNLTNYIEYMFSFWAINGSTGVSLFLFLTGFLFCTISDYGRKKINYAGFVYNRVLRIFPLLIVIIFIVITMSRSESTPMDIFRVITLQLNTGSPHASWAQKFYPAAPIWTIGVEFQFYLIFPFLALFLSKYGSRYLALLIVLMISIRYNMEVLSSKPMYTDFYHSIIGRMDQFLVGMLFAVWVNKGYFNWLKNKFIAVFFSLLVFFVLMYALPFRAKVSYTYIHFTVEAILWGVIVVAYFLVDIKIPRLLDLLFSKLGEISFSIYLLHLPIGMMLSKSLSLVPPQNISELCFQFLFKLIVTIIVSFITFYTIEKPFMSLRVKYTK